MKIKTGDLVIIKKNKLLLSDASWFLIKGKLINGNVVIVISGIINDGFINVMTHLGNGWLYKDNILNV